MTRCHLSSSSIYFGRRIMSSSSGRGGSIAMISCCTSHVHLFSCSPHICLRGVAPVAQLLQTCFRLHSWVQTNLVVQVNNEQLIIFIYRSGLIQLFLWFLKNMLVYRKVRINYLMNQQFSDSYRRICFYEKILIICGIKNRIFVILFKPKRKELNVRKVSDPLLVFYVLEP